MTRGAFIGDAQMVYPHNNHPLDYEKRKHYIEQYPFVKKMFNYVNNQSPDHIIFMGDVIDWYSPENIAFALELMSELILGILIINYQLDTDQNITMANFMNGQILINMCAKPKLLSIGIKRIYTSLIKKSI